MLAAVVEFTSTLQGDSAGFMRKMQALVFGVARDLEPERLYVIRIDNWFGPQWMHFGERPRFDRWLIRQSKALSDLLCGLTLLPTCRLP